MKADIDKIIHWRLFQILWKSNYQNPYKKLNKYLKLIRLKFLLS